MTPFGRRPQVLGASLQVPDFLPSSLHRSTQLFHKIPVAVELQVEHLLQSSQQLASADWDIIRIATVAARIQTNSPAFRAAAIVKSYLFQIFFIETELINSAQPKFLNYSNTYNRNVLQANVCMQQHPKPLLFYTSSPEVLQSTDETNLFNQVLKICGLGFFQ